MSDYDKPQVLPAWAEGGDVNDIPTSPEIQEGWPLNNTPPTRQRFNWILNWLANGIRYFMQMGIPEWDAEEDYRLNSRVQKIDGTLWRALRPNTNVEPGTSALDWVSFFSNELAPYAKLDGSTAYTGDLNMNTHKVSGVSDATDADDAVNKGQLDASAALKANKAGDTFTGGVTVDTHAADSDSAVGIVSGAAKKSILAFSRWVAGAVKVRWLFIMDSVAEGGANVGSDIHLERYADDGSYIDAPLSVKRSTGDFTLRRPVKLLNIGAAPSISIDGTGADIYSDYQINGVRRMAVGYNNTTDVFWINRYDLAGVFQEQPLTISRNSGRLGVPSWLDVGDTRNASKINLYGWATGRGVALLFQPSLTGSNVCQLFLANGGGQVGSINTNDSNTSYNTSSDYRLKQNWHAIPAPLDALMRIKFYEGEFKAEPGKLYHYAIAHELQGVVPQAVHGEKDAMGDWHPVLREGADPNNIQPEDVIDVVQDIEPQQVDYSKLIPVMGAAIQELSTQLAQALARIEQLEAR